MFKQNKLNKKFIVPSMKWSAFLLRIYLPKGLYARSLLFVIIPILILQSIATYISMKRLWQVVSDRLSATVARSIAASVVLYEEFPHDDPKITSVIQNQLGFTFSVLYETQLPSSSSNPLAPFYENILRKKIAEIVQRPFWIGTPDDSSIVEIRVIVQDKTLRFCVWRGQIYPSNFLIFLFWVTGSSLILIGIATVLLHRHIRPILNLAQAVENFEQGYHIPASFSQQGGAREIQKATLAFTEMSQKIERQVKKRTIVLAGVSHDMRTILTRFRLHLALLEKKIPQNSIIENLELDVSELQKILETYLIFARGDGDEKLEKVDVIQMLVQLVAYFKKLGFIITLIFEEKIVINLRVQAVRRALGNLISNACQYGTTVQITARYTKGWLTVFIDDDGVGIPADELENVFHPFYRLNETVVHHMNGTGLGLTICREVAHAHKGDILLETSPLGGLRAIFRIPG